MLHNPTPQVTFILFFQSLITANGPIFLMLATDGWDDSSIISLCTVTCLNHLVLYLTILFTSTLHHRCTRISIRFLTIFLLLLFLHLLFNYILYLWRLYRLLILTYYWKGNFGSTVGHPEPPDIENKYKQPS